MSTPEISDGLERVWKANAAVPDAVHDCVHNIVARTVVRQPKAPAICAWDGNLTYEELDNLSSQLAYQLVDLGIVSGDIVPLCFEKSMWTPVAVLGVVKAGAAFVLLDSNLPDERLQVIVHQVSPKLVLASLQNRDLGSRLFQNVVIVGPESLGGKQPLLPSTHLATHPSSVVYIVFTSGSTGVPKGCVITHQNLCSALHHQIISLGFEPTSRVFDFSSYSFDVAIHNIFATLIIGGCVCIPSEEERKGDLEKTMFRMQATLVDLTPTVARLLSHQAISSLKTLILLGEIVTEHDSKAWWGKTRLINAYGPTECTSISTINHTATGPGMVSNIGRGKGVVTWIVNPQDHNVLLPWGQIGELLLEGPIVGLGYLNSPQQTSNSFIESPAWLVEGAFGVQGRQARLYKTGDLARYDEAGNIVCIGRKDTQVKIRGNRVELGEVECRLQDCMPEGTQIVAEAIIPKGSSESNVLAAFMRIQENSLMQSYQISDDSEVRLLVPSKTVELELAKLLPAYMIPSLFFAMSEIPLTPSGKTNRKLLREIGASYSVEELTLKAGIVASTPKRPLTETEEVLQAMWTRILNLDSNNIGVNDSFFQLGGDSIAAMKLAGEARKVGMKLTVADIFRYPAIEDLSRLIKTEEADIHEQASVTTPLLEPSLKAAFLSDIDLSDIPLRADDVLDILPLTNLQETFIAEGISENLQIVDYYYLDLGHHLDVAKFEESCVKLLEGYPILRASFLPFDGKQWMVIPKHLKLPFVVSYVDSDLQDALADFCTNDIASFERNQPIIAFILLRNKIQGTRLVVRLSHAQYDGISIEVIFKALMGVYNGQDIPERTDWSTYVQYIHHQKPKAEVYWRNLLYKSKYTNFAEHFPISSSDSRPVAFRVGKETTFPEIPIGITVASFMSAAWAIFLSQLLGKEEVIYGQLVNGRNAALPNIEEVVGSCINIVPVRVDLSSHRTLAELAFAVQEQFIALGDSDSLGFRDIIDSCTDWPAGSRLFSCTQHQNIEEDVAFETEGFTSRLQRFNNPRRLPYFFFMISFPRGDRLGLQIFAHSHMTTPETAEILLDKFLPVIEKLAAGLKNSVSIDNLVQNIGSIDLRKNMAV
ncbi:hypothetical protein EYC84_006108 [Monilinia fructicola]|uniref:Carrier domain-containing protein n=1 Tax=Monilinia fructicola TaxID=38448 RepID=A0A5M9K5S0_MONFR|nr:hypothetical protein EYC84_006108 [Monilinia fructicola]